MDTAYFSARLSQPRSYIQNGNTEFYSLDHSFADGIWWKFTVISPSNYVEGFIEKIKNNEKLQFEWNEAQKAIYGLFLKVKDIKQEKGLSKKHKDFKPFENSKVTFSLRVERGCEDQLKKYEAKSDKGKTEHLEGKEINYFWETGDIQLNEEVSFVGGILEFGNHEIVSLEKSAELLSQYFPKSQITWLSYCVNAGGWRNSIDIN